MQVHGTIQRVNPKGRTISFEVKININQIFAPLHGERQAFTLLIGGEEYTCGIRYTNKNGWWMSPDLTDPYNKTLKLVQLLKDNGFKENDKVILDVDLTIKRIAILHRTK
jgi:hypothetical protein